MAIDKAAFIKRISELKSIDIKTNLHQASEEIFIGALGLTNTLYGTNSPQLKSLIELRNEINDSGWANSVKPEVLYNSVIGFLTNMEKEILGDYIINIEKDLSGELFADFNLMAKNAIEEGSKDVSAVLACASLEDSLKKLAKLNGLDVQDKEMSDVINALKSKSIIQGTQLKVLQSYTTLRNKAFHAEWDKIDLPEIRSLISFNDEFLIKYFSK